MRRPTILPSARAGTAALAVPPRPLASHARAEPNGARVWLTAVVSLILAGNVMFSRYLFEDSFYDLYTGRYILHHGFPHRDVATVASHGSVWVDQQWLAHVLYYGAWAVGGYRALAAFSALLVTSGFVVLALLMLRRGVSPPLMFAGTLVAFLVGTGNLVIRAQSFAFPCFTVMLWLLLDDDRASRLRARTWLVVPVLVFWANTHGSVLLGAGLVGLYAAYRSVKALVRRDLRAIPGYFALGAVACACVICTPYGTGVFWYYGRFAGNSQFRHNIREWASPSLLFPYSWAFFVLVLGVVAVVAVAWRRGIRPDPLLSVLALLMLAFAFMAIRNQIWFGFTGTLLAADTLTRSSRRLLASGKLFERAVAGVLGTLALLSLTALAVTPDSQFYSEIPRRAIGVAAAVAERNPSMRILGDQDSGTQLLWLYPAMLGRIGYDARLEVYSPRELSAYFDFVFVRGQRWQRVTRGYGMIVASTVQMPWLARALRTLPGWRIIYRDSSGIVLVRRSAPA